MEVDWMVAVLLVNPDTRYFITIIQPGKSFKVHGIISLIVLILRTKLDDRRCNLFKLLIAQPWMDWN
jgi:hypothetical protein